MKRAILIAIMALALYPFASAQMKVQVKIETAPENGQIIPTASFGVWLMLDSAIWKRRSLLRCAGITAAIRGHALFSILWMPSCGRACVSCTPWAACAS